MIIPHQQLATETLQALLEQHALRDGTDYGESEIPLDTKVEQLKQQLNRGEIVLVYSELHESVNLVGKSELNLT